MYVILIQIHAYIAQVEMHFTERGNFPSAK